MSGGEGYSGEARRFPAPRIPVAHPLVALAVKTSAPAGLSGREWQMFDPPPLHPIGRVLTSLRRDVRSLYDRGHPWNSDQVRGRLDSALLELAEVVAEHGYDLEGITRYVQHYHAAGPPRTPESDDKFFARLIRQEANRIDHRRPKGKTR